MGEEANGVLKCVSVIGGGVFGSTIALLLAKNADEVIIFSRRKEFVDQINSGRHVPHIGINKKIKASYEPNEVAEKCSLIFPVLSSAGFRSAMRTFSPHLKPSHILIHGTKGLDVQNTTEEELTGKNISRALVRTMSEVIMEETNVLRIGCLAGPNLAKEILDGQPTATVIASEFDEVVELGQRALSSDQFFVFGSKDIIGAELAGTFKNILAIGSGLLNGKGYGRNMQAMLITRGLREIIYFGKAMGSSSHAFLGTAGIGDIFATCTSENSRNFQVGSRLGKGETLQQILESMDEVAEGIRTLKIARQLGKYHQVHSPITNLLYSVVFEGYDFDRAVNYLMRYPFAPDVDFL
ncbi:MAG: NAD(P)-dependent glycerol-3-phosphate dehydrogenase [Saprospirales bacterium]|nr:MAG: NAD(P)-dependent glycerol-3-phosphate dehydrogenase [Saprospirales bacterium]